MVDTLDARAIEQLLQRFMDAFNDGDVEVLRSSYTDDALVMPPGQESIGGRDAIIDRLWSPVFAAFDVEAELPIEEVQAGLEWGFARGTYILRLVPRDGGEPIVEAGRYIDVLEKGTDGAWRIARAIWNTTES